MYNDDKIIHNLDNFEFNNAKVYLDTIDTTAHLAILRALHLQN